MIIGGFAIYSLNYSSNLTSILINEDVGYLSNAKQLKIEALQHRRYEKDFFLNIGKIEKQKKYISKFNKISQKLKIRMQKVATSLQKHTNPNNEDQIQIDDAIKSYNVYYANFINLTNDVFAAKNITPQKANKLMTPFKKHIYAFEKAIDALEVLSRKGLKGKVDKMKAKNKQTKITIWICFCSGSILLLIFSWFFISKVKYGLQLLSQRLGELSVGEGDLTARLPVISHDEVGQLAERFNEFVEKLRPVQVLSLLISDRTGSG